MSAAIFLVVSSLLLLAWGSASRVEHHPILAGLPRWFLTGLSVWVLVGAVGGLVALYVPLTGAGILFLIGLRLPRRAMAGIGPALLFLTSALLSLPSVALPRSLMAAAALASVAMVLDAALPTLSGRTALRGHLGLAAAMILLLAVQPSRPWILNVATTLVGERLADPSILHRQALGRNGVPAAERVELGDGLTAWIDRPARGGSSPGAVHFHGADMEGARQPAASVVRRSLLEAGFTVLSLDYPGYGQSVGPTGDAPLTRWDPVHSVRTAFEHLARDPRVDGIIVVGHSMGVSHALRLMGTDGRLAAAVLFGGALPDVPARDGYWYRRFLQTHGLSQEAVPMEKWKAIAGLLDNEVLALDLPRKHAPVVFVRFGEEWPNVAASRDSLFHLIPGEKTNLTLRNSDHYFRADGSAGLFVVDVDAVRKVSRIFDDVRERWLTDHVDAPRTGRAQSSAPGQPFEGKNRGAIVRR